MSVFEGYIFEIERTFNTSNNYQPIKNIYWFNSADNKIIGNDGSMILIAEPIENFEGSIKNHILEDYKNNDYYLKYENNKWTLITPNQ